MPDMLYGPSSWQDGSSLVGRNPAGGMFLVSGPRPAPTSPVTAPQPPNTALQNAYNLANTATSKQAGDYDKIMSGFGGLLDRATKSFDSSMSSAAQPYTPQQFSYNPSANFQAAMSNLANLSATGGFSARDIADIRERNISPIRSIYASANRDIDRNRALKGGFSPGYNAAKAKLARELSDRISGVTRDTNADIAQRVAGNKIAIAPSYASAAGSENALSNEYGFKNVQGLNEAAQYNSQLPLRTAQLQGSLLGSVSDALRGMTSLYGTTPALASLYGGNALSSAQLQSQIYNNADNRTFQMMNSLLGR